MIEKEKILDVIHVGDFPVYEVVEVRSKGDIKIRYIQNSEESITLVRGAIPKLVHVLDKIKI